ncbi:MAG: alpha/beta fold hydrolase [Roseimicrobium sp.]
MSDRIFTLSTGNKLGYAEYGDPGGLPLFYFHGWPSSRTQGELMHEVGVQRGLRIIAPDRPGIGLSTFQPDRKLLDWPPVLAELADALGCGRFHLLGVSGGGPYVLATVHALAERVLTAGVICGAPPLLHVGTQDLLWTFRLALWGQRHAPALIAPGLVVAARFLRMPREALPVRAFIASLAARDQEAMNVPELYGIISRSGAEGLESGARGVAADGNIYSSDWGIPLESVSFPIHYWHGTDDRHIPPSMVERFVQRMPNATLSLVDGEGHYSLPALRVQELLSQQLAP